MKNRRQSKDSGISIREEFIARVLKKRNELYQQMGEARSEGKFALLQGKLIIESISEL